MKTTSTPADLSTRNEYLILFLILIFAIVIRLYSINYDLPFVYDQDEPMFVQHALSMLKNRDLNPHWFGPPASTTMYLLAVVYGAIFGVGRVIGTFQSAEDFRNLYYSNPTAFYLSGRIICALFGVATIWLVYKLGRRLFGSATGLMAAAILTLSPIHLLLSQQVRMDMQMTFLIMLAFWYCLNILEKHDWTSYLLAGFFTGLATVTKYPAIVFSVSIAITHFLATPLKRWSEHRKLLGSGLACVGGAFIGSPFVFLDFRTVLKDVIQEARPEHLSATGEGLLRNFIWYAKGPLPNALSLIGLLLAVVGLLLCLRSQQKSRWVLISFPILFLLFISALHLRWERWVLPAVPFLGLLAAFATTYFFDLLRRRFSRRVALTAAAVLLVVLFVPLLRSAISYARETAGPYTSSLARQWMLDHLKGSRVLIEVYGPRLPVNDFKVFAVDEAGQLVEAPPLGDTAEPGWEIGRVKDLADFRSRGIDYVLLTGYYEHFLDEKEKYPTQVLKYEQLMNESNVVYEVQSSPGVSRGPRVRILQLKR